MPEGGMYHLVTDTLHHNQPSVLGVDRISQHAYAGFLEVRESERICFCRTQKRPSFSRQLKLWQKKFGSTGPRGLEMPGITEALVALVVVFLLMQLVKLQWAAKRLPPGPTPLLVFGNLWTLKFTLNYEALTQLAKTYGSTMTLWMGQTPIVVLTGYQAVRDALVSKSEETSGRALTPFMLDFSHQRGVLGSNGHTWKQQRRVSGLMLRSLGVGKKSFECKIQEEARFLAEFFVSQEGRPMDPKGVVMSSTTNVISAVVFGHRFSSEDNILQELKKSTRLVSSFMVSFWGQLYEAFPWLIRLLPGPHQEVFQKLEYARSYVKQEIKVHQENPAHEPQDVIDLYLNQISKTKGDLNSTIDEDNMVQVVLDFFIAGSETTTETLLWALLYMVAYPDIQEKVRKEIYDVLGPSGTIQYEDLKRLPYTKAVSHEVQRYASVAPIGLPRMCVKDTTIQGFPLAKGTVIVYNLFSVLHDPTHWETPQWFNPGHFLDKEGKFVNNEASLPFSAGHRACVGEQLARTVFFIFFTSLLREFTFCLPDGVKEVNLRSLVGTTLHPAPYTIRAVLNQVTAQPSA